MPIYGCRYEPVNLQEPVGLTRSELQKWRATHPTSGSMAIPAVNLEQAEVLFEKMLRSKERVGGGQYISTGCVER